MELADVHRWRGDWVALLSVAIRRDGAGHGPGRRPQARRGRRGDDPWRALAVARAR